MTMQGDEAKAVLVRQVDQSLDELNHSPGTVGCSAHAAIARGLSTLLECQRASLTGETAPAPARTGMIAAGSGGTVAAVVIVLVEVLQHFGMM